MIEKVKLSEYQYKRKLTACGWQDLVDKNGINQFSCWGIYDKEALFAIQSKNNDNFYLARVLDTYIEEYDGDEIKVLAFYVDIDEARRYITRQ
jgi:hypothetical protein